MPACQKTGCSFASPTGAIPEPTQCELGVQHVRHSQGTLVTRSSRFNPQVATAAASLISHPDLNHLTPRQRTTATKKCNIHRRRARSTINDVDVDVPPSLRAGNLMRLIILNRSDGLAHLLHYLFEPDRHLSSSHSALCWGAEVGATDASRMTWRTTRKTLVCT